MNQERQCCGNCIHYIDEETDFSPFGQCGCPLPDYIIKNMERADDLHYVAVGPDYAPPSETLCVTLPSDGAYCACHIMEKRNDGNIWDEHFGVQASESK